MYVCMCVYIYIFLLEIEHINLRVYRQYYIISIKQTTEKLTINIITNTSLLKFLN